MEMYNMPSDQFGNDLEEDLGWDLDLFDEEEEDLDEDYKELSRIRNEDIRYINGGKYD